MADGNKMAHKSGLSEKTVGFDASRITEIPASRPKRTSATKEDKKRSRLELEQNDFTTAHSDATESAAKKAKLNNSLQNTVLETVQLDQDAMSIEDIGNPATVGSSGTFSLGNLKDLTANYDVTAMNIISSSRIQQKVTKILSTLATFSFVPPARPNIIVLHAKASCTAKMISICDIARREIAKTGGKWYQYNRLEQDLEVRKKAPPVANTPSGDSILARPIDANEMDIDDQEKEEDSMMEGETPFETMKTPLERAIENRPKVRAVPIVTIYLSRVRVERLKIAYGEQTNAVSDRSA